MVYREGAQPVIPAEWSVIEVRTTPDDLARHNHVDVPVVADIRETARALIEAVSQSQTAAHRARAKARIDEAAAFSRRVAEARRQALANRLDSVPIVWERVAQEANLVLEKDAIITHEMNSALPRVMPWFDFGKGNKELFGRTLGSGLGWSVGAAVGIKMAKPDRQVVCMLGDGAFLMGGQIEALWTARRFEVPVLYIVFNNRSFNDTRMRALALAPKLRELNIDLGSYLGNPDVSFERAANAFDVNGATVTKPGEIADALKLGVRELREGRPFVIDVVAERVGLLAESTWYPRYSVADQRKIRV
jgi:thiamine pyrophosphate-dependent acetolactate synthase large subunit-like protein